MFSFKSRLIAFCFCWLLSLKTFLYPMPHRICLLEFEDLLISWKTTFCFDLIACLSSIQHRTLISAFICLDNAAVLVSWTWRPAVVPITQGPAVCCVSRSDRRLTRPSPLPCALPSLRPPHWTLSSLTFVLWATSIFLQRNLIILSDQNGDSFIVASSFCLFFYNCIFV